MKPWYLSVTIISSIVAGLAQVASLFHLNLTDLTPAITDAIGQQINATIAIAGVVGAIVGRFRATTQVTLGRTSPSVKLLPFALALGLSGACALMTGCASTGATTPIGTPTGSVSVPTTTLNTALTAANVLQQFNTGLTASLPTVTQVLTATHNTGDIGIAQDVVVGSNLVSALVSAFTSTVKASQAAGATPAQTQAAANAVLAPASVAAITANVVATSPSN